MRTLRSGVCALASLALVVLVSDARAASVTGGGVDQALGCSSVACGATQTLEIGTVMAPATGAVELDAGALVLSFQLTVPSLPLVPLAADDNGISQIDFVDTVYQAVSISLLPLGNTYVIGPGQTASVSGMQSQTGTGAPPAAAFSAPTARVNGSCLGSGGGFVCGFSFGQSDFSFAVGAPGESRYFQHTLNLIVLPEPTTFALVGLALLGTTLLGRRR